MAYTLNPEDKFGAKDTLAEGHPEKKILGVELDEEFNKIEGAFAVIDPGGDGSIDIDRVDGLQDALDTERQERIDGDANLQGQIDSLENYNDAGIKADLAAETQARIDGDASLQGQIDNFQNYDDTQIKADLTAETQARIDGDTALQSQIDNLDLGGAIEEAPADGNQYARKDTTWSIVEATDSANPVVISDDPPASPEEGDLWYCSKLDDEGLYCWDGAVWFEAGGASGAGGSDPTDLAGYATEVYVDDAIAAIPDAKVDSVNGKTGAVVLSAADVGASTFSGAYDDLTGKPTLYDGADAVKTSGNQTISGTKTFNEDIRGKKNVIAYYSDIRLKDVQGPIDSPIEKVKAIETFYYTHNDRARELGYEGSEIQVGVSAQSVQAVAPELIHRAPVDDDGEGGSVTGESYITVDYPRLVPLLIESIKQLSAEIEELKK